MKVACHRPANHAVITSVLAAIVCMTAVLAACTSEPRRNASGDTTTQRETTSSQEIAVQGIPSQALMTGLYAYMADAATFTRCGSGERYPVASEGQSLAIEQAYLGTPHEPGAPVLVTVQGRFEVRPSMEGEPREHLIVDHLDMVWPEESCEKLGVETPLRNTYWRLAELNGSAIYPRDGQREVHLMLRADSPEVRGFAGCNAFSGNCRIDGTTLHFEKLAATMAACPHLDEETAFLGALETVTRYRILGETLVLLNDTGRVARFRAVYL